MLDIHTIGAGGGSLARFDQAGILHVGPESAGANPGPVCYGRGTQPTVSDANLILGRLHPEYFLDGKMQLDRDRARLYMEKARGNMATAEEFSGGIVLLAEAAMERAIRVISVERGYDPREFTLVAFGGAGPLHACALAKALQIPRVLIPACPGALSALGILLADTVRDYSKTVMLKSDADLRPHFAELEERAESAVQPGETGSLAARSLDLRYAGQGYELNVPFGQEFVESFHQLHQKRYGYADARKTVEIVNIRLRVTVPGEAFDLPAFTPRDGDGAQALIETYPMIFAGEKCAGKVYQRERLEPGDRLHGPAIVVEYSATTVVPPGWSAVVDAYKNLVMEVKQ
jgi:N-methylhydantoinase A